MKIKPAKSAGSVVMELGPQESQLPSARMSTLPLFKLRKILVPVDFSDCSCKALQYAVPLAKQFNAAIILLSVVEPCYPTGEGMGLDAAFVTEQTRQASVKEVAELAKEEVPVEIQAETVVRIGAPSDEIVHVADNLGIDLIVLATHGRTGLKHVLLGSVAEKVVQHARCPVLVVREREREFVTG